MTSWNVAVPVSFFVPHQKCVHAAPLLGGQIPHNTKVRQGFFQPRIELSGSLVRSLVDQPHAKVFSVFSVALRNVAMPLSFFELYQQLIRAVPLLGGWIPHNTESLQCVFLLGAERPGFLVKPLLGQPGSEVLSVVLVRKRDVAIVGSFLVRSLRLLRRQRAAAPDKAKHKEAQRNEGPFRLFLPCTVLHNSVRNGMRTIAAAVRTVCSVVCTIHFKVPIAEGILEAAEANDLEDEHRGATQLVVMVSTGVGIDPSEIVMDIDSLYSSNDVPMVPLDCGRGARNRNYNGRVAKVRFVLFRTAPATPSTNFLLVACCCRWRCITMASSVL